MPLLLPFFKFNVSDWLTSQKIAMMSAAQVGSYIMLLTHCWAQATCTLPSDRIILKTLAKWTDDCPGNFDEVIACFVPYKKTGRLTNPRLYHEWLDTRQRLDILSESGQRGAEKRWQSTREKREARQKKTPKINGKTAFPTDWKLTTEEAAQWSKHGLNPHIEFASFKDHALANDRRCKDWQAAYRNWCRKSIAKLEDRS